MRSVVVMEQSHPACVSGEETKVDPVRDACDPDRKRDSRASMKITTTCTVIE